MKTLALFVFTVLSLLANSQTVLFEKMTATLITNRMTGQQKAQSATPSSYYSFSQYTQPYIPINGTSISNGARWDEMGFSMPIGFNFKIYGATSNTILVNAGASVTFNDVLNDTLVTFVSPILEDLCDKAYDVTQNEGVPGGISNISYETTGAPGNRICKIQVNDATFYAENVMQLSPSSTVNYQIWLYEATNDIEFHYGTINIQHASANLFNGSNGFMCGLIDQMSVFNFTSPASNMLNGPYTNPAMVAASQSMTNVISGNITSGTVYKFSYNNIVSGINTNTEKGSFRLYPDPAIDVINIETHGEKLNGTVQIRDLRGQLVLSEPFATTIAVGHLQKGIYLVNILSENKYNLYSTKLVITN